MWKVNAGRGSALASEFIARSVVAIGWRELGDYSQSKSKSDVLAAVVKAYPGRTDRQNEVSAGQVWRFLSEVRVGDPVITYDPVARLYHLGKIAGAPTFRPDAIDQLPVQRAVTWSTAVSRDDLSPAAKESWVR